MADLFCFGIYNFSASSCSKALDRRGTQPMTHWQTSRTNVVIVLNLKTSTNKEPRHNHVSAIQRLHVNDCRSAAKNKEYYQFLKRCSWNISIAWRKGNCTWPVKVRCQHRTSSLTQRGKAGLCRSCGSDDRAQMKAAHAPAAGTWWWQCNNYCHTAILYKISNIHI